MKIIDFSAEHIPSANDLALFGYAAEACSVPSLPAAISLPDMMPFVQNGLGVSAFEGDEMVGFLCVYGPFTNAFCSTDAVGVFSPMGLNGTISNRRASIYAEMYHVAAEKWVKAGATSHSICLYTHDREVTDLFFRYGFGMRCVDAIREMDPIQALPCKEYEFCNISVEEISKVLPLEHLLDEHMASSPTFIRRPHVSVTEYEENARNARPFVISASYQGRLIAFIRAEHGGENCVMTTPGYIHITGAFCHPCHRGKGVMTKLLSLLIERLSTNGFTRIGVDFESINPSAHAFWLKYFHAYTQGVARRIDEHVLTFP